MDMNDIYYKAMLSKDYRFDGKFFVGVKTTMIYCRPICPARPQRKNIIFFQDATSAEKAGYRPCLRCHPEFSPLSPAWSGKSAVIQRALRIIAQYGIVDDEDTFAEQFGVSARHLRRLFKDEIGLTPKQISDNNRLNFAHKLIVETNICISTAALTVGFTSLRRFNDAFKKRYHHAPSNMRKKSYLRASSLKSITLKLPYRPPLDWLSLIDYFQRHPIPHVEQANEDCYERIFKTEKSTGFFRVEPDQNQAWLNLSIYSDDSKSLFDVVNRVRKMFDLDSDPLLIANQFESSQLLSALWKKWPGLRLARGWDAFETAICTLLGQGVSIEYASKLAGQLVLHYGEEVYHPLTQEKWFIFPSAKILMNASLNEIKTTQSRKTAIRELSRKIFNKKIILSEAQDSELLKNALTQVKGIGRWSAEYICLRALGDTNAFPATDLILERAIKLNSDVDFNQIMPWRGYSAIYLWKNYAQILSRKGGKSHGTLL